MISKISLYSGLRNKPSCVLFTGKFDFELYL